MTAQQGREAAALIFKIAGISHGWFDIDLNRQFILVNSDFLDCDAPALLLDALGCLLEGTSSVKWLCWQNEPGAYLLRLEREENQLVWEVYETDRDSTELEHSGPGLADHAAECVYRFEEDIFKSARAVEAEFNLYEKGNGRKRYRAHWGDFPHREYGKLKMLLQMTGYSGTPPEGALNGYQKKFLAVSDYIKYEK